jgi:phytoene dehydrogenase-like protein
MSVKMNQKHISRNVHRSPHTAVNRLTVTRSSAETFNRRGHRLLVCAISSVSTEDLDVVVVGAGVAGLHCAGTLHRAGAKVAVIEASDGVGGRVRSDKYEGFVLDRGFQIFLTSYPEAQRALDYDALQLKPFYAGALVRWGEPGRFYRVADPARHLADGLASLFNPIGSVLDKIRVGVFRVKSVLGYINNDEVLSEGNETTTLVKLRAEGFSEAIIDRFFRPFLGGIFFDRGLNTSSRLFVFVMRMLALGENCLPAQGIGSVSLQLASRLPPETILLNTPVVSITKSGELKGSSLPSLPSVTLADGSVVKARAVVVATDGPTATRLLGSALDECPSKDSSTAVGTCNLYFDAPRPPLAGNILYLNGTFNDSSTSNDPTFPGSLVNNCCFPSEVAPTYAPPGHTLVSVSTVGTCDEMNDAELQSRVLSELSSWFGGEVLTTWRHLKTYRIPYAQPNQAPPTDFYRPQGLGGGVWVVGDHRAAATLDGALRSGRTAAEDIIASTDIVKGLNNELIDSSFDKVSSV